MPGLGRRTFAPGEVLTATNVMGYLQDQAVMNFAGTAARGSAIGTAVSEGMVSYLADSNLLEAYDGSAWKPFAGTAGAVLQHVSNTYAVQTSTTSTTFVTTGLSVSITPKRSNSKFLVMAGNSFTVTSGNAVFGTIFRDSTNIGPANGMMVISAESAAFTQVIDLPATSSAVTYSLRFRVTGGTGFAQNASALATISVLEIAA